MLFSMFVSHGEFSKTFLVSKHCSTASVGGSPFLAFMVINFVL